MLDKAAGVGGGAGPRTKPHFQHRERARDAEPCLRHDDRNCHKMRQPKPEMVHPVPSGQVPDENQREAGDDECCYAHVQDQHEVGEESSSCGTHVLGFF